MQIQSLHNRQAFQKFQQNDAIFGCARKETLKESREVLELILLWSSLLHVTSQLGEGYSMIFVRFPDPVEDLRMKQFWSVFLDGFLENFTEVWSMFETSLSERICSYLGELESLGQGWKQMKAQASCPGGGHLGILWVGMCRPGLQIGTPF